jgi:glycosyltransferase involved in cell wall biosynthesis
MRIVLVNWARIWEGAGEGGGVNQYCQALALELVRRGHDVVSLFSGQTFCTSPPHCFVRRHDDWLGVRVFEVVNSPVIAPGLKQFNDPMGEVSAPELEARLSELFAAIKPDAVHWNNLEGFSAGCVAVGKKAGAKAIFSLHNYHTACPQVYFMKHHREACHDFDNGHECAKCITVPGPAEHRAKAIAEFERGRGGTEVPDAVREFREAVGTFSRVVRSAVKLGRAYAATRGRLPGRPVDSPAAATAPQPAPGDDARGKTPYLTAELNPPPPRDMTTPEFRVMLNVVQPEPASSKPLNEFGKRRAAMVEMLSSCDRVLAVSEFVRAKYEALGVDKRVLVNLPIGSRINRVIALKQDLLFDPPRFDPPPTPWEKVRPVRFHFMGYNNWYKGLSLLIEVLETVRPEHLRRMDWSVFALEGRNIEWMWRRLEPRLAGLKFYPGYNYHDIPWMLGGRDITVVPSVWWDNGPQTVFESLTCGVPVLGAELGGIPDFVKHGHNGLLFRGNDREDLRAKLVEIVENPWRLETLRANVKPCKSIEDHAAEMEGVYAGR